MPASLASVVDLLRVERSPVTMRVAEQMTATRPKSLIHGEWSKSEREDDCQI